MIQKSKGLQFENDQIEVFFGNKLFSLSELTNLKPTGVHTVKQTHSDIFHIINRNEPIHPQPEGDALGTEIKKQYLAIKTADCLPVMIHDPVSNRVAAVHAGWKGVANRIVPKTIAQYFSSAAKLYIFIGPHIMQGSFEIKEDVLSQLRSTVSPDSWKKVSLETKGDRYYVNLVSLVRAQIEFDFPNIQLEMNISDIDTKTNEDYNSYRRDASNAGRNISYIRLK
jgi:YfiH family protein